MKALLLMGGLLGFGIGLIASWVQENPWPTCLWHACLAAYLSGILLRWWGRAWRANLEQSCSQPQSHTPPTDLSKAIKS